MNVLQFLFFQKHVKEDLFAAVFVGIGPGVYLCCGCKANQKNKITKTNMMAKAFSNFCHGLFDLGCYKVWETSHP